MYLIKKLNFAKAFSVGNANFWVAATRIGSYTISCNTLTNEWTVTSELSGPETPCLNYNDGEDVLNKVHTQRMQDLLEPPVGCISSIDRKIETVVEKLEIVKGLK